MNAATMKARFESADNFAGWPDPDLSVLNAGRRAPVAMPSALFGPAWPLLQQIAEGTCSPVDYPALGFAAACASLIGGKRRVRPYDTSTWAEPCILWTAAVGDPSSRKSPALDTVTAPLRAIEQTHTETYKAALLNFHEQAEVAKSNKAEWKERLHKAAKNGVGAPPMPPSAIEPEEPIRRRTMVQDSTPEAVGSILAGNPQGVLMLRDELAAWLTSFERYSPGGREFWIEAYGGRGLTIDRKGSLKGPISIPFNGVSVCGGIQPDKMAGALLAAPDDGFVARFLWCWPDPVPFTGRPRQLADVDALERAYRRLDGLGWAMGPNGEQVAVTLPLSVVAANIFEQWAKDNSQADESTASLLKSFVGKMDGTVLRLALVAEHIRWAFAGGAEPSEVSELSLIAAAELVDDYLKAMAERVYGDAALPKAERHGAMLAHYIQRQGLSKVNKRELKRSPHKAALPGLRDATAMDAAFEVLVDAGILAADPSRDGDGVGRQRLDYLVNPKLREA